MFKAVIINYNFDPKDWWLEYGYKPEEVLLYDRSDDGIERKFSAKVVKTPNVGQVDYDKLNYLIEYYDDLADNFLWIKSNLFKYISKEEYEKVKDNTTFTPLLTIGHKTYTDRNGWVCFYGAGWYNERNDNWFFGQFQSKYVNSFAEWAGIHQLPNPSYIPFAPGGNYILTRERVHKYSKDYYIKMADMLPYCQEPVEAQCAERSYGLMWKDL